MTAARILRFALLVAVTAALAVAAAWSVRLAWADAWFRTETASGTEKAIRISPGQSEYHVRLALLIGDDQPARAFAELRRALALNPHDARAWIELGLRDEATGDLSQAESALLRAAAESRIYLPRWTLVNYYFRRNDESRFWYWARQAVPMIWGDPLPLFRLCGRVREDGELLDRLDIRKPELQASYLFYLLDSGRADLAGPASQRLLRNHRQNDVPLLLNACDRLLAAGRADGAIAIWNSLETTGRIPARGAARPLLYNGDFSLSPSGHGFDWRLPTVEGVSAAREEPAGLRLTFSGSQPEAAEPLVEFVPVDPGAAYQLTLEYRTDGIPPDSGLSVRIAAAQGSAPLAAAESLSSDQPSQARLRFSTPPECRLLRLSLFYRRSRGTTRIAGFIILRTLVLNRT